MLMNVTPPGEDATIHTFREGLEIVSRQRAGGKKYQDNENCAHSGSVFGSSALFAS